MSFSRIKTRDLGVLIIYLNPAFKDSIEANLGAANKSYFE